MTHEADKPMILRPAEIQPIPRGAGILTRRLIGSWNTNAGQLTSGTTEFAPGTMIAPHSHNVEETIMILQGEAAVFIGGERVDLIAGDVTWVPGGVHHYFVNRGDSWLRIYWVYAGRDVTRTLIETGETIPHLSERDLRVGRAASERHRQNRSSPSKGT
jgi:HTH-type transcriptional repressor of puuD